MAAAEQQAVDEESLVQKEALKAVADTCSCAHTKAAEVAPVLPRVTSVRVGVCDTCGGTLPAHRGGMCALCILGLARALIAAGRLAA